MHRLSRRFFLIGALGALLVLVGMDFYAGSSGVKQRMESALSQKLRCPVKVGGLHFTPWSGLRATGVTIAFPGVKGSELSLLSVPSVSAKVAFVPLFSGHVVIKKLLFKDPALVWVESGRNGDVPHPEAQSATTPVVPSVPINPGSIPAPELQAAKPPEPVPSSAGKKTKRFQLEFRIQTAEIENATFRFVDREGKEVCLLEGIAVRGPIEAPDKASGSLSVLKVFINERLTMESFSTPFVFHDGMLSLSHIDARLAKGSIRGEGTLTLLPSHPPFTLDLLFDDVDLDDLLTKLGDAKTVQQMSGTLHGNLDLYGHIGKKKSFGGAGQMRLHGGRMEQFPLLQLIGKVLPIEELKHLELRQAQLDLRVGEGKVFVDSLVMESVNLGLTGNGISGFDGKLNLAARLAVSPKVSRQLPGWIADNFQPVPGSDRRDIGFAVTGTLLAPETDLMRVMLGQRYGNQILNLWQSLTSKPKKKTNDKKKIEAMPSPTEEGDEAPVPESHPVSTP